MPRLVIASGNRHKIEEIAAMLAAEPSLSDIEVVGSKGVGQPPEIEETAPDFHGNAVLKAEGIASWLRGLGQGEQTAVLADDSGVCVDAFDGAPGVRSARFAGEQATDEDNNRKLVEELRARGLESSPAHYICVLALTRGDGTPLPATGPARPQGACVCFEGTADGEVRIESRGSGGFGYDPHLWVDGGVRTYAELTPDAKAARSHRGHAMRVFLAWVQEHRQHLF